MKSITSRISKLWKKKKYLIAIIALATLAIITISFFIIPLSTSRKVTIIDYVPSRILYDYVMEGYNITYIVTNRSNRIEPLVVYVPDSYIPYDLLNQTGIYAMGVIGEYGPGKPGNITLFLIVKGNNDLFNILLSMKEDFLNNFNYEDYEGYYLWFKNSTKERILMVYDNKSNIIGYCRSSLWSLNQVKDGFIELIEQFKHSKGWISWDYGIDQLINKVPLDVRRKTAMLITLTNGFNVLIFSKKPIYEPRVIVEPNNSYIITGKNKINYFEKIFKFRLEYEVLYEVGNYALYLIKGGKWLPSIIYSETKPSTISSITHNRNLSIFTVEYIGITSLSNTDYHLIQIGLINDGQDTITIRSVKVNNKTLIERTLPTGTEEGVWTAISSKVIDPGKRIFLKLYLNTKYYNPGQTIKVTIHTGKEGQYVLSITIPTE